MEQKGKGANGAADKVEALGTKEDLIWQSKNQKWQRKPKEKWCVSKGYGVEESEMTENTNKHIFMLFMRYNYAQRNAFIFSSIFLQENILIVMNSLVKNYYE